MFLRVHIDAGGAQWQQTILIPAKVEYGLFRVERALLWLVHRLHAQCFDLENINIIIYSKLTQFLNNLIIDMQAVSIQGIPLLLISPEGIFKYILIQVFLANKFMGHIVRGSTKFEYHAQNYRSFAQELKNLGFVSVKHKEKQITAKKGTKNYKFICEGGGRIEHNHDGKKCSIYGYSKTYGKVNHKVAQEIVSKSLGYPKEQILLNQKQY